VQHAIVNDHAAGQRNDEKATSQFVYGEAPEDFAALQKEYLGL